MSRYEKIEKIGEGQYGVVYKAKDKQTSEIVALKRMRLDQDGIPCGAVREIAFLKKLRHDNIVRLLDVVYSGGSEQNMPSIDGCQNAGGFQSRGVGDPSVHGSKSSKYHRREAQRYNELTGHRANNPKLTLVFEFLDYDLSKFMQKQGEGQGLEADTIRCFMRQLLCAVEFCHRHMILHRDLKPQNLLISDVEQDGDRTLRLADFGLARSFTIPKTRGVHEDVTLWYQSPELLLGSAVVSTAIDMWSVGCIFAEMGLGRPPFMGRNDADQLRQIVQFLGTPSTLEWPSMNKYPLSGITFERLEFLDRLPPAPIVAEYYRQEKKHLVEEQRKMKNASQNQGHSDMRSNSVDLDEKSTRAEVGGGSAAMQGAGKLNIDVDEKEPELEQDESALKCESEEAEREGEEEADYREEEGFERLASSLGPDGVDLLLKILKYEPSERLSAADALRHPYFLSEERIMMTALRAKET